MFRLRDAAGRKLITPAFDPRRHVARLRAAAQRARGCPRPHAFACQASGGKRGQIRCGRAGPIVPLGRLICDRKAYRPCGAAARCLRPPVAVVAEVERREVQVDVRLSRGARRPLRRKSATSGADLLSRRSRSGGHQTDDAELVARFVQVLVENFLLIARCSEVRVGGRVSTPDINPLRPCR